MLPLFATETTQWNAWAILALLVTNIGTLYQLFKRERRTDSTQDAKREDTVAGQWRAWGKDMQMERLKVEKRLVEAECRERLLIADNSKLAEQVRHFKERLGDDECDVPK